MAGTNKAQGQLIGPFSAGQELMDLISEQCVTSPLYVEHIGIQTEVQNVIIHPETLVEIKISGQTQTIEVGKTGIYEIGNTKVTSIKFLNDRDNNTIVDYIVVL